MTRRKAIISAVVLAFVLLLTVFVVKLADGTLRNDRTQEIVVPDTELDFPRPEIVEAPVDAKLPKEAAPEITTEAAPPVAPTNIPFSPFVSTPKPLPFIPFYQAPITPPQVPLTGPQPPLSQPILPSPVQPLVPIVERPLEGVLEPLRPVTDPLLGAVEDVLPSLPKTIEVGIEIK